MYNISTFQKDTLPTYFTLKMEAVCFFGTSETFATTTRCHNPEEVTKNCDHLMIIITPYCLSWAIVHRWRPQCVPNNYEDSYFLFVLNIMWCNHIHVFQYKWLPIPPYYGYCVKQTKTNYKMIRPNDMCILHSVVNVFSVIKISHFAFLFMENRIASLEVRFVWSTNTPQVW